MTSALKLIGPWYFTLLLLLPLSFECFPVMNNVYIPVHVALLLRRLANVISGLSISNQYLLAQRARAEERDDARLNPSSTPEQPPTNGQWPKWMLGAQWDWSRIAASPALGSDRIVLKCPSTHLATLLCAHV